MIIIVVVVVGNGFLLVRPLFHRLSKLYFGVKFTD
jgi:hypothetical protein